MRGAAASRATAFVPHDCLIPVGPRTCCTAGHCKGLEPGASGVLDRHLPEGISRGAHLMAELYAGPPRKVHSVMP
eukprot:1147772-Pelagomonas_calceolata.AAC.2